MLHSHVQVHSFACYLPLSLFLMIRQTSSLLSAREARSVTQFFLIFQVPEVRRCCWRSRGGDAHQTHRRRHTRALRRCSAAPCAHVRHRHQRRRTPRRNRFIARQPLRRLRLRHSSGVAAIAPPTPPPPRVPPCFLRCTHTHTWRGRVFSPASPRCHCDVRSSRRRLPLVLARHRTRRQRGLPRHRRLQRRRPAVRQQRQQRHRPARLWPTARRRSRVASVR